MVLRVFKARAADVAPAKIGVAQVGVTEIDVVQIGAGQVRPEHEDPVQVGALKGRVGGVDLHDRRAAGCRILRVWLRD